MTSKFGSDLFIDRHLGLGDNDERIMLNKLGFNNIDQFINQVIPDDIQLKVVNKNERVLITTLTKKMAEELVKFFQNLEIKSKC